MLINKSVYVALSKSYDILLNKTKNSSSLNDSLYSINQKGLCKL